MPTIHIISIGLQKQLVLYTHKISNANYITLNTTVDVTLNKHLNFYHNELSVEVRGTSAYGCRDVREI